MEQKIDNFLKKKYILIILSFAIAFMFWFVNKESVLTNEVKTKTIGDVPINYVLPDSAEQMGLSIIDSDIQSATVTVTGNVYTLEDITADDVLVSVQPYGVTSAGTYYATVEVKNIGNKQFSVVSSTPRTVNILLDRIITREFAIELRTNDYEAVDGCSLMPPTLSESKISITGPATKIQSIKSVVAELNINDKIDKTKTYNASLKLLGENNSEINVNNLTISRESVEVSIVVTEENVLPVVYTLINQPTNFNESKISLTLSELTVEAPKDMFESVSTIDLGIVDYDELKKAKRITFDIDTVLGDKFTNKSNEDTIILTLK